MPYYCTLQGARRQLSVDDTTETAGDPITADYIPLASQAIEDYCGRHFDERIDTRYFNGQVGKWNPILSLQGQDLISVDTLLNGDGSAIASGNYTLLPRGGYPKHQIRVAVGTYWLAANQTATCPDPAPMLNEGYAVDAISVTGKWGFNRKGSGAWRNTGLSLSGAINDSTTTITLSGTIGTAFDVGSVLKIGSEYMPVTGDIDNSTETGFSATQAIVERGYNGSTAAAHSDGDPVYVWQMEYVIELAARMAVAAFYVGRNNATGDRVVADGIGAISIPVDLPAKIKGMLGYPYYSHYRGRA